MAEKKKRGRPKIENSRNYSYVLRLNDREKEVLDDLARENNLTKSEVIRRGLLLFKNFQE